MPDRSYILFDTAVFGAAAADHNLFKVAENGDTTHTSDFTNMRGGGGSLPAGESFEVRELWATPDDILSLADSMNWLMDSYVKLNVANEPVFHAPLYSIVKYAGFEGAFTLAAAADQNRIGRNGMGYQFNPTVIINGGTSFNVFVRQGTATAAAQRIKVCLEGILTLPGQPR